MNIGSRPSKRKPSGGIESLRAIPWIFAWTQTRFHLPVWLGFGAAFKHVIQKDIKNLHMLQEMYNLWPFFRVTIDLVEMVFAKGDPGIAALYDKLLVSEELQPFGEKLRANYAETKSLLLQVCGANHWSDFRKVIIVISKLKRFCTAKLCYSFCHDSSMNLFAAALFLPLSLSTCISVRAQMKRRKMEQY